MMSLQFLRFQFYRFIWLSFHYISVQYLHSRILKTLRPTEHCPHCEVQSIAPMFIKILRCIEFANSEWPTFPVHAIYLCGTSKACVILGILYINPTRAHNANIDDSLMLSSITSMMHQFHIDHRKHSYINVSSMCSIFSTLKPAMFHGIDIDESSIEQR